MSVYDLQLEPQTRFGRRFTQGDAPLPNDDASAAMFCAASRVLGGAGYEHYEISNFAQPGARSVHNQVYWACRSYYAFGLGAASYLEVCIEWGWVGGRAGHTQCMHGGFLYVHIE